MDIKDAKRTAWMSFDGKPRKSSMFTDAEKERVSQIAQGLKGLTISEAQSLLQKVSDALVLTATVS